MWSGQCGEAHSRSRPSARQCDPTRSPPVGPQGHGFAVLSYDKRGVGGSTGDWRSASFHDLAGDALAGVRLLRTDDEIDPAAIGVLGWSNGGWVAPLVARAPEVAFAAVGAAPGFASGENIAFEVGEDLKEAGFSREDMRQAVALRRQVSDFVTARSEVTAAAWDSLRAAVAAARTTRWFGLARVGWVLNLASPPDTMTTTLLAGLRSQWRLDPVPEWAEVRKPILIMLGGMDNAVPARASAARLRETFSAHCNRQATVRFYETGSHALFQVPSAKQRDVLRATAYVRGFPSDLIRWLEHEAATGSRASKDEPER